MRKVFMLCALLLTLTAPAWAGDVYVDANTKEWTNGNNYIVAGNVTINDRIQVKGSVTLTLLDGCKLEAKKGIDVS